MLGVQSWIGSSKQKKGAVNPKIISRYYRNPDFPFLISFPRTGSHWFRIILEEYSLRPLLTRSFYDHDNQKYLLYHTHDMNLAEKRHNVIYLYRNPTEVVYSQLRYYKQDLNRKDLVLFWANHYLSHLIHWLFMETHSQRKTLVRYENIKEDFPKIFAKVCLQLDLNWDEERLKTIMAGVDRNKVADKTSHNRQVVNLDLEYEKERLEFGSTYSNLIQDVIGQTSEKLLGSEKLVEILEL